MRVPGSCLGFQLVHDSEAEGKAVRIQTLFREKKKEVEDVGLKLSTTRNLICEVMLWVEKENRTTASHDVVQSRHSSNTWWDLLNLVTNAAE